MLLALEDRRYEVCVSWGALYRRVMMGVKNQLGGCDHVRDFLKGVTSYDSVLLQIYLFGNVGIIQTIIWVRTFIHCKWTVLLFLHMPYAELIVEFIPPQTSTHLCYRKMVFERHKKCVVELKRSLIFTAFPVSSRTKERTYNWFSSNYWNNWRPGASIQVLLQDLHLFIYYNKFHVYPFTSAMLACRRNSANWLSHQVLYPSEPAITKKRIRCRS